MKTFKLVLGSMVLLICLSAVSFAQSKSQKSARLNSLLDSKSFVFRAESATPMGGGNIRLTSSYYNVQLLKDSLNSFLPYFGTAFRSSYGSAESPLDFTSSDFSYESKTNAKGMKTITVRVNQPSDPATLIFSVGPSGYGTLQVSSLNRQPISFYGVVEPLDESKN
jgi:hypothetical protein